MIGQPPRSGSSGSTSGRSHTPAPSQDMRAKAGEAAAKVADATREAGGKAKRAATSLTSDATKQAKGFLNMQVTAGADMFGHVAESARAAADSLDPNAPQLAGLVRNAADRAEEFSEGLREQTVDDLIKMASDFTRKQPALVFGLASLAGFLAFRVLKSSTPRASWEQEWEHDSRTRRFEGRARQFHGA
jgi:hypothetical protein